MALVISSPLDWDAIGDNWVQLNVPESSEEQFSGAAISQDVSHDRLEYSGTYQMADDSLRGRFIVWRVVEDSLYLVETSLDSTFEKNAIKLVFPAPIVPNVCFFSQGESVRALVLTASRSLHRFTFHGSSTDSIFASISTFVQMMSNGVAPPGSAHEAFCRCLSPALTAPPTLMTEGIGDRSVILSCRDGSLATLFVDGGVVTEKVLQRGGGRLSGMVTVPMQGMASSPADAYTFTLSRDAVLSGWSVSTGVKFVSMQLRYQNVAGEGDSNTQRPVNGLGLRVFVAGDSQVTFVALVQQTGSNEAQFQTISAVFTRMGRGAIEMEITQVEEIPSVVSPIVDFTLGPVGLVCLHLDGMVSSKVGKGWQAAGYASLGHIFPTRVSDEEWAAFVRTLSEDPFLSPFLLKAIKVDLTEKGFLPDDDSVRSRSLMARALEQIIPAEREVVVNVVRNCNRQFRFASSVSRIGTGLPLLVGPGGVSVLYPIPALFLWPDLDVPMTDRTRARLLMCCKLADSALTSTQWQHFDDEAASIGPEEACLSAMRVVTGSALPLDLPLAWSKLDAADALATVSSLIAELADSRLPTDIWKDNLLSGPSSNFHPMSGHLPVHAAACAIRSGAEGAYRLARSLLVVGFALVASHHASILPDHRLGLRGVLLPRISNLVRNLASLRAAARAPSQNPASSLVPFAQASRAIVSSLVNLSLRNVPPGSPSSSLLSSFTLYAWFVASTAPPLLFLRALHAVGEYHALRDLSMCPGQLADAVSSHFTGLCLLKQGAYEGALQCFQAAVSNAEAPAQEKTPYGLTFLSVVSGQPPVEVFSATDQYWLNVMNLFEAASQPELVVRTARLALHNTLNPRIFWSSCFRHNLLLKRYLESYGDIQAAFVNTKDVVQGRDMLLRRLRKFVLDAVSNGDAAKLCEFPFVGEHINLVADILVDLASLSDMQNLQPNYFEILYAYHVYRGSFRQAAIVMYDLCVRLKTDSHAGDSLSRMSNALSLVLSALQMAPVPLRWIPNPVSKNDVRASPKRSFGRDVPAPVEVNADEYLSMEKLQQEFALVNARISLRNLGTSAITPSDAFSLLVSSGRIAQALSLGKLFALDLGEAFEAMTKLAIRSAPLGDFTDEWGDAVDEGLSSWTLLERHVKDLDSRKTNYSYARRVAITMLNVDPTSKLPLWLTSFLNQHNPEALLHVYLMFSMSEEATSQSKLLIARGVPLDLPMLDKVMMMTEVDDMELRKEVSKFLRQK